jgi:hypothetical protein
MKVVSTIARYLLGLMFTVFGLNGFLNFIPAPPPPPALAGQFLGALAASHYLVPVFLLQLVSGLLFLANRYVPLALTLIGPVIVNILLVHVLMSPSSIVPGLFATVCWLIVFYRFRAAFAGIFQSQPSESER